MKITLNFKTPDVIDYALEDIEDKFLVEKIKKSLSKWIKYGECVTLEYDSDDDTIKVC